MKISGSKVNIIESADKIDQCKKKWVKPEVELISSDGIQSGSARFVPEGQRSTGSNRIGYS